ncbi:MAG: hypothetical protein Q8M24_18915 [Pseudolabrys sp.]|nr:hypothetical protein [Pseudolabrys sp.]MDP2297518.1 hypothetical protein [Pseudolabrys sp.]
METERKRPDESTKANEEMNRTFNKDGGSRSAGAETDRQPDAEDIKDKSVENATDAALVRRPYP